MGYVIGTDEAGYGPNLGPLVIAATIWKTDGPRAADFYAALGGTVTADPRSRDGAVVIADSKQVYQPAGGLAALERSVLAALAVVEQRPRTWTDVWETLAPQAAAAMRELPWYADFDATVPLEATPADVTRAEQRLAGALDTADLTLVDVLCRPVFPAEFNDLVDRFDSKGTVLSRLTLELVSAALTPLEPGPVEVVCDKNGGRDFYAGLLAERFCEGLVEVRQESRAQSVYRLETSGRRAEFRFCAQAESYLPVALASMTAKYLRELAMAAFNDFWCDRMSGLRPTAGYPVDARRFKAAIAPLQRELDIDDRVLWRNR